MAPNGLLAVLMTMLCCALADQPFNSSDTGMDTVAPEDTESEKAMRVGDPCEKNEDCSLVPQSFCNAEKRVCVCPPAYPVNATTVCRQERMLNDSCIVDAECTITDPNLECRDLRCQCISNYRPSLYTGGTIFCTSMTLPEGMGTFVDPTMIGVLVGMVLMFIIMCVVLRLFSKARWRENRTIFNTPNPRLANASLLKEATITKPSSRRGSLRKEGHQESLGSIPRALNDSTAPGLSVPANGASRRPSVGRLPPAGQKEDQSSQANINPNEAASLV